MRVLARLGSKTVAWVLALGLLLGTSSVLAEQGSASGTGEDGREPDGGAEAPERDEPSEQEESEPSEQEESEPSEQEENAPVQQEQQLPSEESPQSNQSTSGGDDGPLRADSPDHSSRLMGGGKEAERREVRTKRIEERQEIRDERKEERQELREERKEARLELREERKERRALRRADPGRLRNLVLPALVYNPDDGLGFGGYAGLRRAAPRRIRADRVPPLGDRPWIWDLNTVALLFFRPYPSGWTLNSLGSWFPEPSGRTELEANFGLFGWAADWWFGIGNDRVRDERVAQPENADVSSYWHRFGHYQVRGTARVRHRVAGAFVVGAGLLLRYDAVEILPDTLLEQEVQEGDLLGAGGGGQIGIEGSLIIDTRDDLQDPMRGIFLSAIGEGVFSELGPSGRFLLDLRGYISPPKGGLVFAGAAAIQAHLGPSYFFDQGTLAGPGMRQRTLCGVDGVRGLDRGRVRGPLSLLLHGELRFRPPGFQVKDLHLRLTPAVFVDATRADLYGALGMGPPLHGTIGGGLRLVLNEQSLVRLDLGTGPEQRLSADGPYTHWGWGFYAAVRHLF